MSVNRIKLPEGGAKIEILCDTCGLKAPPAEEILKGFGLNNMGWDCRGGVHLCPQHVVKES